MSCLVSLWLFAVLHGLSGLSGCPFLELCIALNGEKNQKKYFTAIETFLHVDVRKQRSLGISLNIGAIIQHSAVTR